MGRLGEQPAGAEYYALTRKGRGELDAQTGAWRKLALAVGQVLDLT